MRAGNARHVQRFAHRVEMETNDSRRQTHGRNAAFGGQTAHGGLAHLKDFGELLRGQKLFAIRHGQRRVSSLRSQESGQIKLKLMRHRSAKHARLPTKTLFFPETRDLRLISVWVSR